MMGFHPDNVEDGVFDSINGILGSYTDADAINAAIYGDLTDLNVESDVETILQTYTDTNTSYWDELYIAPSGEYVGAAVSDITLGLTESALVAQKGLGLTITNELKALVAQPVTIKTAVIEYFDGQPVKAYIDKATGLLVRSETVLSETTHIPVGKFLAGMGHAVSAYAIFETFKDTITASYNATLGQEDTFTPLQEYLIAGTAAIAGGAAAGGLVLAGAPAIFVVGASGAVMGMTAWAADTAISNLPTVVNAAKVAGKTLQQTLDDAYAEIQDTINDAWNATGTAAENLLDDAQGLMDDLLDGAKDLLPNIDLPRLSLPDWVPDVTGPFEAAENTSTPLVLDLAGTGINLVAAGEEGSVYWNFDGGDFANASGWIAQGSGLLAIDLNSDGIINDHSELFGTETTDGFTVLTGHDIDSDNDIDANDTDWSDLLVWTDANSDGYSQATELHTLSSLGITSINLNATQVSYDIAGNHITHESTFTINGQAHDIVDAWFAYDTVNTIYAADYTLDARTMFLPTLRGYGQLPDLHIAMSQDEDLLDLVQTLATADLSGLMDPAYDLNGKVQDILFQWANVQNVDPDSRGLYTDARVLGFLEALVGEEWSNFQGNPEVVALGAGQMLTAAWNEVLDNLTPSLLVQAAGAGLFSEAPVYDPIADAISIGVNADVDVSALATLSAGFDHQDVLDSVGFWTNTLRLIDAVIGVENLDTSTIQGIDNIIQTDDPSGKLTYDVLVNAVSDSIVNLNGDTGDNVLVGGDRVDTLYGGGGNDIFVPGRGTDKLHGDAGDDTFAFALGESSDLGGGTAVRIYESLNEGNDTILFLSGINADDVYTWADSSGHLFIKYSPTDEIEVMANNTYANGTYMTRVGEYVEQIVFDDSTVWDLTGGLNLRNDDTLRTLYGSAYGDTIEGGALKDTIRSGDGDDVLIGNAGRDFLYGGVGNDKYVFALGDADNGGSGQEVYIDEDLSSGTDTISFAAGVDPGDVFMWTDSGGHLYIKYSPIDYIEVSASRTSANGTYMTRVGEYVEQIVFDDSTTWNLTGGLNLRNDDTLRTLYGSAYGDTIEGGALKDTIRSGDGDDVLIGNAGRDFLYGSAGNDTFVFGIGDNNGGSTGEADYVNESLLQGADTISFMAGISPGDVYSWTDSSGNLYINYSELDYIRVSGSRTSANGTYMSNVGEHLEQIVFADSTVWDLTAGLHLRNDDTLRTFYGSAYDDTLEGGALKDTIHGGDGNDLIIGNDGPNRLYGDYGDDTIVGGAGNEYLYGGNGADSLYGDGEIDHLFGGAGADTFVFGSGSALATSDIIEDFSISEQDVIDLTDILSAAYDPLQNAITDFVQITDNGTNSTVAVDANGGADNFVTVATILGVTGLTDEAALETSGQLLTA